MTTLTPTTKVQLGGVAILLGGILTLVGMIWNLSDNFVTKELFQSELNAMRRENTIQFDTINRRISDLSLELSTARKDGASR